MDIPKYLLVFIASFIVSLIVTPVVRVVSTKFGKVAEVREDRWHKKPTPLLGGIAIWSSWIIITTFFIPNFNYKLPIILSATAIFALGLIDDIVKLNPQVKLVGQIIIASSLTLAGIIIEIIPYPVISIPFTILWLVAITNSFNLLDNMDGLSAGIAVIAATSLGIFLIQSGNHSAALLTFILAGASLGFLVYNFNPAKIFMGDCGSMFLGFLLSSTAIIGTWREASSLIATMVVPLLVLGIPIFDTTFVTLTRKLRGDAISQGGKDHISHRLVALGLSERQVVLSFYGFSIFFALLALYFSINPFVIMVISVLSAIGFYLLGIFLGDERVYSKSNREIEVIIAKRQYRKSGIILSRRRIAEIIMDLILISVAYFSAYLIRFEGHLLNPNLTFFVNTLPWVVIVKVTTFYYFGVYQSIWRYVGIRDMMAILKGATLSTLIIMGGIVITVRFQEYSRAVFIVDWLFTVVMIGGSRLALRSLKEYLIDYRKSNGKKAIIIGAGDAGDLVLREIRNNHDIHINVVGFIDDDPVKQRYKINGVPVLGKTDDLKEIKQKYNIEDAIVAIPSASRETMDRIINKCKNANLNIRTLPPMKSVMEAGINHSSPAI
jgi:UDP-GlcNAc:undecaprenyl-phosphate GlcNAc-1-phosphate transferase